MYMNSKKQVLLIIFSFLILNIFAQQAYFTIDNRISSDISSSESMTFDNFGKMMLIASGDNDNQLRDNLQILDKLYIDLEKYLLKNSNTEISVAENTLLFLYESLFSTYSENQTQVNIALQNGTYNCVSSTLIYMYFIKRLNIPVVAVKTPIHEFCSVIIDNKKIDVETTNPFGFNPGVKKQIQDSPTQKKYTIIPPANYNGRHDVDDRVAISVVYDNRITSLQKQKKQLDTISLSLNSSILQNNSTQSIEWFHQCVCNAAIDLANSGNENMALSITNYATQFYGDSDILINFREVTISNHLGTLLNKNNIKDSYSYLEKNKTSVSQTFYSKTLTQIKIAELSINITQLSFEQSLSLLEDTKSLITQNEYIKYLTYIYSAQADRIQKEKSFLEACIFLQEILKQYPNNSSWKQQLNVYSNNYAISVHNQATEYVNNNEIEKAKTIIKEGLSNYPNNKLLQNDLNSLK